MIIKQFIQGSSAWLAMRKKYIMASDAPIIMGMSPWRTRLQLWEEKLDLKQQPESNFAMSRGVQLEPRALQEYNNRTGNNAKPCVVFSEDIAWMGASLDGLSEDQKIVVEIKCPGKTDHELASFGKIPDKYIAQLQHQLYTSGNYMLHYFSYSEESSFLIEVTRDEIFIKRMLEEEKKFWDMLQNFESPEVHRMDVLEFTNKSDDSWMQVSGQLKEILNEKQILQIKLKHIEQQEAKLKEILIASCDGKNCRGNGITLELRTRKGLVDYSLIPELKNVDLELYRKCSTEYWKVS